MGEREALDLTQLVSGMVGLLTPLLGEQVVLSLELPEKEQIIQADPSHLEQILINLVGNAIKFTFKGAITVRMSYD